MPRETHHSPSSMSRPITTTSVSLPPWDRQWFGCEICSLAPDHSLSLAGLRQEEGSVRGGACSPPQCTHGIGLRRRSILTLRPISRCVGNTYAVVKLRRGTSRSALGESSSLTGGGDKGSVGTPREIGLHRERSVPSLILLCQGVPRNVRRVFPVFPS